MRRWSLILATLSPLAAVDADAQASFTPIGVINAEAVSDDGSIMVGSSGGGAARWIEGVGTQPLGNLPGSNMSQALDVSADGTIVVGVAGRDLEFGPVFDRAFRWTQAEGMVPLGDLPGGDVYSWDNGVSADGTVIAGNSNSAAGLEGFRWTAEGGMAGLGFPAGMGSSSALGISNDGSTVVGCLWGPPPSQDGEAFYWTEATGMVGIGSLATTSPLGCGRDASADGSVIVGHSHSPNGLWEAFRWTADGGMVGPGDLPGGVFRSFAEAVSGDGSIVVGQSVTSGSNVQDAFIWDAANGMRLLTDVLQEQGVDMTGWRLRTALAISSDGTTIVGSGTYLTNPATSWIAVIPEPSHGALLGAGMLALAYLDLRRHRRRTRSELN